MDQGQPAEKPSLSVEEISSGTVAVAAQPDLAAMASRFFALVQSWGAPSVVLCVEKDDGAETGWRLIPELTSGPAPAGIERSVAKFVSDAPPGSLVHPALVRPTDEVSGLHVKLRDSWVVPWACGGSSGFLLLRGIPQPYPPNLGDAVALASQPLWPRLGRPRRLEDLLDNARGVAERLAAEVRDASQGLASQPPSAPAVDPAETAALKQKVETLEEAARTLEKARSAAEAERDRVRGEAEAERDRARREAEELRGRFEETRRELTALQTKVDGIEKARSTADEDRARAEDEAAELRDQVERLEREAETHKALAEEGRRAIEEGRNALDESRRAQEETRRALEESQRSLEQTRRAQEGSQRPLDETRRALEEAQREASGLRERLEALGKEHAGGEAERARAKTETHQLWTSIESLQRQIQTERERFESEKTSLAPLRAAAEKERDEARAAVVAATENAAQAVERSRLLEHRWEESIGAFRAALEALRRTPFVPPTLRVSLSAVEGYLGGEAAAAKPASRPPRVLVLDREAPSFERLAAELEAAGVEVLIAHYPEEVGIFLKTPDSRRLTAVVCDVMAFRPDQDLTALFRAWRQDLSDLGLLLSFKTDNPAEAERAQRVPSVITSGYLQRPLQRDALLEAIGAIAKRHPVR